MIMDYEKYFENIFLNIIEKYDFFVEKKNPYQVVLANQYSSIIIMVDRFEQEVSFFLYNRLDGKQYPFWRIYKKKGKPIINIKETDNKILNNLIWHSIFIENYLQKELSGDFSDLKDFDLLA